MFKLFQAVLNLFLVVVRWCLSCFYVVFELFSGCFLKLFLNLTFFVWPAAAACCCLLLAAAPACCCLRLPAAAAAVPAAP